MILRSACVFMIIILCMTESYGQPSPEKLHVPNKMAYIPGGTFIPLYNADSTKVEVDPFFLDKYPVTNAAFYKFLQDNPKWRKSKILPLFADQGYLRHWPEQLNKINDLGNKINKPVVNISWFAARSYCKSQGKRLPTADEWEFVALASETKPVGAEDPEFYQKALDWYSKPSSQELNDIGSTFKNYYGVYDMYGLVWEWVQDYNSALLSSDSRQSSSFDTNLFCGGGAAGSTDPSNYVAFMRYAMRASLEANFTVGNLGFRCAKELN